MGGGWIVEVTARLPDDRGVATETFNLFVEAVSSDSIINQSDDQGGDTPEHEDDNMDMSSDDDSEMHKHEDSESEMDEGNDMQEHEHQDAASETPGVEN